MNGGRLPETSNCYCHPGKAGGLPWCAKLLRSRSMSKHQVRPFTVEIRSSRKNSRDGLPIFPVTRLRSSALSDQWLDDHREHGTDRDRNGLRTVMPEANLLHTPTLVRPLSFDQPTPEHIKAPEEQNGSRLGRILPSLTPWMPSPEGPQPQDSHQRSAPRRPRRPRQTPEPQKSVTVTLQDHSKQVSNVTSEPAFDQVRPSFPEVIAAIAEPVTRVTSHQRSLLRRSGRALERSWSYRIECRKAERRGNPHPAQPQRRK